MTPEQCRLFFHRLKTALNHSVEQADSVINGRLIKDCIQVLMYCIEQGDILLYNYLLMLKVIRDNIAGIEEQLLRTAYCSHRPQIVRHLLTFSSIKQDFLGNLDAEMPEIILRADLDTIKSFMNIPEFVVHIRTKKLSTLSTIVSREASDILQYFIDEVFLNITFFEYMMMFEGSLANESDDILKLLIKNENENVSLITIWQARKIINKAINSKKESKVESVLSIPIVAQTIKNDKEVLMYAINHGNVSILKTLVNIPELKYSLQNKHLNWAVYNENIEMIRFLMTINKIKSSITYNAHQVIENASYAKSDEVLTYILDQYPKVSLPIAAISRIYHKKRTAEAGQHIKSKIFDRPFTVPGKCNDAKKIEAMQEWLNAWEIERYDVTVELDPVRWCDHLYRQLFRSTSPKQAAIIMLSLNEMAALQSKKLNAALLKNTEESAMDSSLVAKCSHHFEHVIKPVYQSKFEEMGGIEGIEKIIKAAILDKIIEHSSERISLEISRRRAAILAGDEDGLAWMIDHSKDVTDIYQTCWRAYDPKAKSYEFRNLLTAPDAKSSTEDIFNIPETGVTEAFKLKRGSDMIREKACYLYLLATDPRLSPSDMEAAKERYFAAIAEIRRSNNIPKDNKNPLNIDSPACFPGCITHLASIVQYNHYIKPVDFVLENAMHHFLRNEFRNYLKDTFQGYTEKVQIEKAVDALTLLSSINAWDIIVKPLSINCPSLSTGDDDLDDHPYDEELLNLRLTIICRFSSVIKLMKDFVKIQPALNHVKVTMHERVFVEAFIADIGQGESAALIKDCAEVRIKEIEELREKEIAELREREIAELREREVAELRKKEIEESNQKNSTVVATLLMSHKRDNRTINAQDNLNNSTSDQVKKLKFDQL